MKDRIEKVESGHASRLRFAVGHPVSCVLRNLPYITQETLWITGGAIRAWLTADATYDGDIDVIFFNKEETSRSYDEFIESEVRAKAGIVSISVKNQARLNKKVDKHPYEDLKESIGSYPDSSVAWAARISAAPANFLSLYCPYGLESALRRKIHPTSRFIEAHGIESFVRWCDRKKYDARLRSWEILMEPLQPAARTNLLIPFPSG